MRFKYFFNASICIFATACASTKPSLGDWPLQWQDQSARLTLIGRDGKPQVPFNGDYFSVPGYIFVAGQISLHPGMHRISYGCPPADPNAPTVNEVVPTIDYTFEAGKKYELRCSGGAPIITPIE